MGIPKNMRKSKIVMRLIDGHELTKHYGNYNFEQILDEVERLQDTGLVSRVKYIAGDFPELEDEPEFLEEVNAILSSK